MNESDPYMQTESKMPRSISFCCPGITGPVEKNSQESSCLASTSLDDSEKENSSNVKMFPDWSSKNVIKAKV